MLFICWCNFLAFISQADVGWLSVNVTKSLRAFVERVNTNFRDKNVVFYYRAETGNLWLLRDYYESRFSLRWELYKSRMSFSESSRKAGYLSLRALGKQDLFWCKPYKSRMSFVENSTIAGCLLVKALWKQDDFCWEFYESRIRMTFVESSSKAGSGWL